jgi:GNAT superfamily N-acetyltransferase
MSGAGCDARIRPACRDDAALLVELIGELAEYERLADCVRGDAELLAGALFDDQAAEAILAEVAGEAAGYAIFFSTFSSFECRSGLWVEDLFVRREQRGRGIGRALLGHIAGLAMERNCARLEWSALDWNSPALRFYESLGASLLEQWRMLRLEGDALRRLGAGPRSASQGPES